MDDGAAGGRDAARYWLALLRAPHTGPATLLPLLHGTPNPADWFLPQPPHVAELPSDLAAYLRAPDWPRIDADLKWLEQSGSHLIPISDPRYPPLLTQIPDPPVALFVHGDTHALQLPQMAIVGSRNPSAGGAQITHDFAAALAASGLAITSGLAVGIDAAAHNGALAAGGVTLAVMGTGLDRVYPARHRQLAHDIAERGALISELPPATPVRRGNFPRRNRLISGLTLGTLVVEAALHSGSLITAREAMEQGREVFAVPGSIHNPLARGCHRLIRDGATLVESADDIVAELAPLLGSLQAQRQSSRKHTSPPSLDADYRKLLDSMGFDPLSADEIIARSGLTAAAVSSMLLLLEMQGLVSSEPGGRYCRIRQTS